MAPLNVLEAPEDPFLDVVGRSRHGILEGIDADDGDHRAWHPPCGR
jgi:hypothetical protein